MSGDTPSYRGPERRQPSALDELRDEVARLATAISTGAASLRDLVAKHNETLYGNGRPGLTTRIDRLEQTQERERWVSRTAVASVVAVAAKAIYDLLTR